MLNMSWKNISLIKNIVVNCYNEYNELPLVRQCRLVYHVGSKLTLVSLFGSLVSHVASYVASHLELGSPMITILT